MTISHFKRGGFIMDEKMLALYFPASYKDIDIQEFENIIHGGYENE
jgi:hypothetical protein